MTGPGRSGVRRVVRLAALSLAAKGPGFLIPLVIASAFGAVAYTDAYFLAYAGFLIAGGAVGPALEVAVVPYAAAALARGRQAAAGFVVALAHSARSWGVLAAIAGALLLAVGLFVAPPRGVSPGLALGFYLLMAPAVVAWCVAGVLSGALTAAWRLETSALGNAFRGVGALLGAVVAAVLHSLWPVAVGLSVGEIARAAWLGRRWTGALRPVPEGEATASLVGFPSAVVHLVATQAVLILAPFVERFIVGTVALAAISHVEYATRLVTVASVAFDGGVGPWLLARWANLRARSELHLKWTQVYRLLAFGAVAALAISALIAIAAQPLVRVLLLHGAFSESDAETVTRLLRWYAGSFFFTMTALCIERLLLARSQYRLFLGLGVIRASLRLTTLAILIPRLGIIALPVANGVADAVHAAALLVATRLRPTVPVA